MSGSLMIGSVICIVFMHAMATIVEGDRKIKHLLSKEPCDFISIKTEPPLPYQGTRKIGISSMYLLGVLSLKYYLQEEACSHFKMSLHY